VPTYISLINWTQQGIANVKQSPNRLDAARKAWGGMGVQLKGLYLTLGQYDLVTVFDAPNDEAAAKAVLMVAAQGNVSTQTMRAFTEDEYRKIVGAIT
jgi:uncharacterized protein with GYD domain